MYTHILTGILPAIMAQNLGSTSTIFSEKRRWCSIHSQSIRQTLPTKPTCLVRSHFVSYSVKTPAINYNYWREKKYPALHLVFLNLKTIIRASTSRVLNRAILDTSFPRIPHMHIHTHTKRKVSVSSLLVAYDLVLSTATQPSDVSQST